jgi:phospholipid-translocating ATPase
MEDRDEKCNAVIEKCLEKDMELCGITGVEDMLQEDIYPTLEKLRNAGISIWMLTGDKIETAMCIAISTGLKSTASEMYVIKEISDPMAFQNELNNFTLMSGAVLVIDGQTLQVALETENFF